MPRTYGRNGDPRLKTKSWKDIVAKWHEIQPQQCKATRCLLPSIPIQYGGKRGPAHLDVGHIVPRIHDPRLTWTIEDTRPEHARCSRSAGVNIGRARRTRRTSTDEQSATAARW